MSNTAVKGTLLEQTRIHVEEPFTGKLISGKDARLRERGSKAKVARFRALNINGEFYYPTSMLAYFLTKASKRRKPANIYTSRRLIATGLSEARIRAGKNTSKFKSAFVKLDGHWFTTKERFNSMWTDLGHPALRFKPEITIVK